MNYHITIAGVHIRLEVPNQFRITSKLKKFITKDQGDKQPDMDVAIYKQYYIDLPKEAVSLDEHIKWRANEKSKEIDIYISKVGSKCADYLLKTVPDFSRATIFTTQKDRYVNQIFQGPLGEILFRNFILSERGIVIHAAAISCRDKGIIFSAPSGTGKTTQANLWKKYKQAKLINADRPTLKVEDNEVRVYGTLWNGSASTCINNSAKLEAIVMLEQSPINEIKKLNKQEAIAKVLPRCFLPYFTKERMGIALKNIENIIEKTPVYLLKCRPDREAVELVNQCLESMQ